MLKEEIMSGGVFIAILKFGGYVVVANAFLKLASAVKDATKKEKVEDTSPSDYYIQPRIRR